MKEKKNIILLIFAVLIFIGALIFLVWSFNAQSNINIDMDELNLNGNVKNNTETENKTNSENIDQEVDIVNNVDNQEISNTQDVEDVSYTDITVYNENNDEVSLSEYTDNSVVLLFWSPENEESIEVLKKINDKYEKYKEKIKFLMISTSKEVPENIKSEISMDIYYDVNNEYKQKYNVQTIPTMIYIYKDNSIMNAKSGMPSSDAIEANLDLLADNF